MIQHSNAVKHFGKLILNELNPLGINCWIAGGAVKNYFMGITDTASDTDIFFTSEKDFEICKKYLLNGRGYIIWNSENGTKIVYKGNTFDLIKKYFTNAHDCISNFDFTVVMFAVTYDKVYYGKTSFMDLAKREIIFNSMQNPASTMTRCFKYYKKGFTLSPRSMKILIKEIHTSKMDPSVYAVTDEETSGVGIMVNISNPIAVPLNTTGIPSIPTNSLPF